ncbi:MAG: 50S ribosomal protein L18 [Planctomycetes bacterium]|nr:50S ribosomal protein L18 [Planctomycetota bacterium]
MERIRKKWALRERRHQRAKRNMLGTPERPRLSVYRSLTNIYAQVIDDTAGSTLVAASSQSKDLREAVKYGGNVAAAKVVGKAVAQAALGKGIKKVVFDRGGYMYHGRVKALAEAARAAGLSF